MTKPFLSAALICLLAACGSKSPAPAVPAKKEVLAHESDLLKITLTPEAERRLGVRVETIGPGGAASVRDTSGEIVVPASGAGVPTGSTANLAQIGAQQAAADGELARTRALVQLAVTAYKRADDLVTAEAGSVRARDEAAAALATARAAFVAAEAQRRLLGPDVAAMGNQPFLWVRVPVFGSDIAAIARDQSAAIRPLGSTGPARAARPVAAPPSANAVAGTVDLFFTLDNRDRFWRVGQRVSVSLPMGGSVDGISIPTAAIVRDIYGGEWVYRRTADRTYVRQRVEIASVSGDRAIVARGLESGAKVVTDGAAELFGTEFGAPH